MPDIHHRLVMKAPQAEVFSALTDAVASLANEAGALFRTLSFDRDEHIVWQCVDGPADWVGTEVAIDLAKVHEGTVVHLEHRNWRDATDALATCATRWARMLLGLECYVAFPEPNDTRV